MENNNDVVIINLDRPRAVRYGHKALKMLCAMFEAAFEDLEDLLRKVGPEDLEKIMYCGLLSDANKNGEILTLEQMEDLLDYADRYADITDAMNDAINMAFADKPKNPQGTVKKQGK